MNEKVEKSVKEFNMINSNIAENYKEMTKSKVKLLDFANIYNTNKFDESNKFFNSLILKCNLSCTNKMSFKVYPDQDNFNNSKVEFIDNDNCLNKCYSNVYKLINTFKNYEFEIDNLKEI